MSYRLVIASLCWLCLLGGATLRAAVITWANVGTDWATGANWGGTAPADDTTTDVATFTGAVGTQPNVGTNRSVAGVDFQSAGWTLTQNNRTLTLGAGGIDSAGAGTNTVDVDVSLSVDSTWTIGAGNQVTIDETISGAGRLTKDGAGTLFMDGNNSYSGGLTLNAGTIIFGHDSSNGSGTFTINGGTVSASTTNIDINESIVINGNFAHDASGGSRLEFDGPIDLGGGIRTITDTSNEDFRFRGVVSNGGLVIDKTGTEQFTLSGNNTYTLGTTINNGTIELWNNNGFGTGAITINNNPNINSNNDARTIANNFVVNGTLDFTGQSMTVNGNIDLNGGARTIDTNINDDDLVTINGIISNGSFNKTGADTLVLTAANTYAGGTTFDAGVVTAANDNAFGTGTLDISGGYIGSDNDARSISNAITFSSGQGGFQGESITMTGNIDLGGSVRTLEIANNSGDTVTLTGVISQTGTGSLTKTGSETLILGGTGANTYTGDTTVSLGTLQFNKTAGTDAVAGALIVGDGIGNDTAEWGASNQLNDTSDITLNDSAVIHLNNFSERFDTFTLGDGTIDYGTASGANYFLFQDDGAINGTVTINDFESGTDVIAIQNGATIDANFLLSIRFAGSATGAEFDPGNLNQTIGGYGSTWDYLRPLTITEVWDGGGADNNWNTNNNWQDNTEPGTGNNVKVEFSGNTRPNVTLNTDRTVNALLFTGTTDFTISGANTLTFDNATVGTEITQESTSALTISSNVVLAEDLFVQGTSTGKVTLSGVVSGAQRVYKRGSFELELSGANTYSADFVMDSGTVTTGDNAAFGTGNLEINGGTIQGTGGALTHSNNMLVNSDFTIAGSQDLTFSGGVDLRENSDLTITVNNTGDTTFSGDFTNGSTLQDGVYLHKAGTGRLIITSDNDGNDEIQDFYLDAGTVALGHDDALGERNLYIADGTTIEASGAKRTYNGAGSIFVNGNFSFGGTQELEVDDEWQFGGATRTITLSGTGLLHLDEEIKDAAGLVINGPGTIQIDSDNDATDELLSWTLNSGTFRWGHDDAAGRGLLTVNGGTLEAAVNGIDINQNWLWGGDFAFIGSEELDLTGDIDLNGGTRTITHTSAQTLRIQNGATISNGGLVFSGTGEYIIEENNTFAGGLTFNGGVLDLRDNDAPGTGTFTINGGELESNNDARTLDNAIVIGGDFQTTENDLTFTGTVDLSGGTHTITTNNNASDHLELSGVVSNGGIIKAGTAELRLSGNNTFAGGLTLNAGELGVNSNTALGTGTFTINGGDIESNDALRSVSNSWVINNSFQTSASNIEFTGTGTINAGTHTITNDANTYLSGNISGAGKLIMAGPDEVRFSGDNNAWSGGFQMDAGTVGLRHNNALGSGTFTINGGDIESDNDARTIANAIVVGGDFSTDTNSLTFTGNVDLGAAVRTITVAQNGGDTVTFTGILSGTGGLTKHGAEDLILSGNAANTYSGTTTVTEGILRLGKTSGNAIAGNVVIGDGTGTDTLQLDASNQISDTADITFNAGGRLRLMGNDETLGELESAGGNGNVQNGSGTDSTLTILTSGTDTFTGTIEDGGVGDLNLVVDGNGELVVTGTTSYTGTTTIDAGATFTIGGNNQLNSGNDIILSGGTFNTSGFDQTLDNLTLTADSVIDLGAGDSVLSFTSASLSNYTLDIYNWSGSYSGGGTDQFFVNTISSGSVPGQVRFFSDSGTTLLGGPAPFYSVRLATNEIVPAPEPSTWFAMVGLLGLISWHWRARRKSAVVA